MSVHHVEDQVAVLLVIITGKLYELPTFPVLIKYTFSVITQYDGKSPGPLAGQNYRPSVCGGASRPPATTDRFRASRPAATGDDYRSPRSNTRRQSSASRFRRRGSAWDCGRAACSSDLGNFGRRRREGML